MQEKKNDEKFKVLEEQVTDDIEKIKADHAEDMKNMEKKIKTGHAEDMKNMEKKIKTGHDEDLRKMEKKHTEEIKVLKMSLSIKQPMTPVIGFHVALSKFW